MKFIMIAITEVMYWQILNYLSPKLSPQRLTKLFLLLHEQGTFLEEERRFYLHHKEQNSRKAETNQEYKIYLICHWKLVDTDLWIF